jgi:hypothetical protein
MNPMITPMSRRMAMGGWALTAAFALALAAPAIAQDDTISEKGIIAGTMDIDFQTRSRVDASGNPEKGVKDKYKFTLNVAKTLEFAGSIGRVPQLKKEGGLLQGEKEIQGNQLEFDVNLTVISKNDPTQRKTVGKWVGEVPINDRGEYAMAGTGRSANRIAVDAVGKQPAFTDMFGGKLVGKPKGEKKAGQAVAFVRKLAGKEVKIQVKNSDPMRFEGIELAKGPADVYPHTIVNGNLDYDYDTGNWYTNGITFRYSLNGKDVEDKVTGSIKWVEDPSRATNGKGFYEFNLRFNEAKYAAPSSEDDAFKGMSDEDAFFAVDNTTPSLTGKIEYVDTMAGETVTASKVVYSLDANKLTKQQVVNFFKLWLLGIGPINDE